ncbi:MAG: glycosyl transferase group 1 [Chthoniobacteraceae bacterium]|nr:glycosyl transferase group 1 [Chthoniobacteraceae bacterium]
MRISIIIYSLGSGGAERVATTLANYWAAKHWEINLMVLQDGLNIPFYELHSDVSYHPLGVSCKSANLLQAISLNIHRVRVLRASILNLSPDVIISFMCETNVITLMASAGLGIPVIVREANDPRNEPIGRIWQVLRRLTYTSAKSVILLNKQSLNYFSVSIRRQVEIIPNAVNAFKSYNYCSDTHISKTIVSVGRLVRQKGYDILLEAFNLVAWRNPDWTLRIYGDGPLRSSIEAQIKALGLSDRVYLEGVTKNISDAYRSSDLFVMSSRFEGFPNSLCEAMAAGLPVISFDCPTGPSVIIRHGIDGLLVPQEDTWALAEAMENLIADRDRREAFGEKAKEVTLRFSTPQIMSKWEEIIGRLVQ